MENFQTKGKFEADLRGNFDINGMQFGMTIRGSGTFAKTRVEVKKANQSPER